MVGIGEEEDERKNVLGHHAVPKQVRLPDGTSFVARYERISRSSLPGNIRVTRTSTVGPRNRQAARIKERGKTQPSKYTNTGQGKMEQKKIQEITIW